MPRFSRKTIIAAVATLEQLGHAEITRFLLEHQLEEGDAEPGSSKMTRANEIIRYLLANSHRESIEGGNLVDDVVRDLTRRAYTGAFDQEVFEREYADLLRALKRDGFEVTETGELRRALPESLDLPAADDEVHRLLDMC